MFSQALTDTDVSRNPSQCVVCGKRRPGVTLLDCSETKQTGDNTEGSQHKYLESWVKS